MSDRDKGKPSKSVMGNLPSTRPTRMGRRRDGDPAAGPEAPPARAAAKPRTKAEAKPARTTAKTRATTARKPTRATPKATGRSPERPAGNGAASKPRAVRSGSPSLDAAQKSRSPRRQPGPAPTPPKGAELVTTAVQATGELAKIGLTLGGQALKRAVDRLPKP